MSVDECRKNVSDYRAWIREAQSTIALSRGEGGFDIPLLDCLGRPLKAFVEERDGLLCLHDGGAVLGEVRKQGVDSRIEEDEKWLRFMLRSIGVQRDGNRLFTWLVGNSHRKRLHLLVQGMLAVQDTYLLGGPRDGKAAFGRKVSDFLKERSLPFLAYVMLKGKSRLNHGVDFALPWSPKATERIVKAINAPNMNTIAHYLFVFSDAKAAREKGSQTLAFLNDEDGEVDPDVIEALEAFEVQPMLWSKKEGYVEQLES